MGKKKVKVDADTCIGCGLCAGMCPQTFQMNLDNKSEVVNDEVSDCAENTKDNCPVQAISIND